MIIQVQHNRKIYTVDSAKSISISTTIHRGKGTPNAYRLPAPNIQPFSGENFTLDIESGAPVNCETIFLAPHGNGTHTECVGHISRERIYIKDVLKESLSIAHVVTVLPLQSENDFVITKELLKSVVTFPSTQALIIRTLPNTSDKLSRNWSGTNPVYLEADAALYCVQLGVQHLVVDFPSVDREEDGGMLQAHHAFWSFPEQTRINATITEMAFIPNEVNDGMYLLQFHVLDIESDASPSKLVLYTLEQP